MDQPRKTSSAASILVLAGVCLVVAGVVALGAAIARASGSTLSPVSQWPLLLIAAGVLVLAGMAVFLVVGIRHLMRLGEALAGLEREIGERRITPPAPDSPAPTVLTNPATPSASPGSGDLSEVLHLLRELRELYLLPEDERRRRAAELAENELARAESEVHYFITEGDFARALSAARLIAARRPDDLRATELVQEVEAARQQREADDFAGITREINDLISMSAWSQARKLAQELQVKRPDDPEARQLMLRIEREYRISQDEQRRRLYAEVQRFVSRKRWEEAKAAANAFVERFAGSDDAEAVRLQMPTLELNAEIETRQRLEAEIMVLVKHGRYIDATALARRVIEQYPDSPQADALRQQIGRLEELATNPDAPPARVRIE